MILWYNFQLYLYTAIKTWGREPIRCHANGVHDLQLHEPTILLCAAFLYTSEGKLKVKEETGLWYKDVLYQQLNNENLYQHIKETHARPKSLIFRIIILLFNNCKSKAGISNEKEWRNVKVYIMHFVFPTDSTKIII